MTPTSSAILTLRTPHLTPSSSSGVSCSSSLASIPYAIPSKWERYSIPYKWERWNLTPIQTQSLIHQFLDIKDQALAGQVNKTWREGILHTWKNPTPNHEFSWRETSLYPVSDRLTNALIDIVSQMQEEENKSYESIALDLKKKYQYLMNLAPSFKCYVMKRLTPHLKNLSSPHLSLRTKAICRLKEFRANFGAKRTIYKKSKDLAATSDVLLYVLMEIEKISLTNSVSPRKLDELFNLVLRAIDNGVTCASLLMAQTSHIWSLERLEKMAIASLKKGDCRALDFIVQTYFMDNLQRLQSENPRLVLPSVLYRLALQEEDPYNRDVALEATIEAYKTYSRRPVPVGVLCNAANTKFEIGDPTAANDLFVKAMRVCGDKVPAFVLLSVAHFKCKIQQYEEANSLAMRIIIEDPDSASPPVWSCSAYAKMKLERYEDSIKDFEKAINKYRETHEEGAPPGVLANAATALVSFNQQKKTEPNCHVRYLTADQYYTEAIEKYGDEVPYDVLTDAADVKFQLAEDGEAVRLYTQAMEVAKKLEIEVSADILSNMAYAYLGMAYASRRSEYYIFAIKFYTQAIEKYKKTHKNGAPQLTLACAADAILKLTYQQKKAPVDCQDQYDTADQYYTEAIEKYGDEVPYNVLFDAIDLKIKRKEYKAADTLYLRFRKIFKGKLSIADLNNVVFAKLKLGEYREVVILCTPVITKLKSEVPADILAHLAHAYLGLKRYERAVKFCELAIEKYGAEVPAEVLEDMAYAHLELQHYEDAVNFYNLAIEKYGDSVPDVTLADMALAYLGFRRLGVTRYKKAIEFCGRAIEKYGAEVPTEVLTNMAYAHLKLKNYKIAIEFYKQAITKCGDKIPDRLQREVNYAQSKFSELQEANRQVTLV